MAGLVKKGPHRRKPRRVATDEQKEQKKRGGKYANWCRRHGHPPTCSCEYDG